MAMANLQPLQACSPGTVAEFAGETSRPDAQAGDHAIIVAERMKYYINYYREYCKRVPPQNLSLGSVEGLYEKYLEAFEGKGSSQKVTYKFVVIEVIGILIAIASIVEYIRGNK